MILTVACCIPDTDQDKSTNKNDTSQGEKAVRAVKDGNRFKRFAVMNQDKAM